MAGGRQNAPEEGTRKDEGDRDTQLTALREQVQFQQREQEQLRKQIETQGSTMEKIVEQLKGIAAKIDDTSLSTTSDGAPAEDQLSMLVTEQQQPQQQRSPPPPDRDSLEAVISRRQQADTQRWNDLQSSRLNHSLPPFPSAASAPYPATLAQSSLWRSWEPTWIWPKGETPEGTTTGRHGWSHAWLCSQYRYLEGGGSLHLASPANKPSDARKPSDVATSSDKTACPVKRNT